MPLSYHVTCRASNRTGRGSKTAFPVGAAPSLSEWSSLGWVTRDAHKRISQGKDPPSAGVRGTPGDCVQELLWDDVTCLWAGEEKLSLCLQSDSPGVDELALPLLSGCWRRSCTSGRGAWVVTRAPYSVSTVTRTFTSKEGVKPSLKMSGFRIMAVC